MDNISFAQRMVGAIILLSLAIIFVPMILEPEDDISDTIKGTNIPSMPDNVATMVFQMDNEGVFQALEKQVDNKEDVSIRKALEEDNRIVPEKVVTSDKSSNSVKPENGKQTTRLSRQEMPVEDGTITWMVQLGTFGNQANATKLRDELRAQGYACYLRERKGDKGSIWQVRVGPILDVKKATDLKQKLEKITSLDALVIRHP